MQHEARTSSVAWRGAEHRPGRAGLRRERHGFAIRRGPIGMLAAIPFALVVAHAFLARPTHSASALVEVKAERMELPASQDGPAARPDAAVVASDVNTEATRLIAEPVVRLVHAEFETHYIEASVPRPGAPLPSAALGRPVTLTFNDDFNAFSWNQGFFRWSSATQRREWVSTSRGTWTTQYHWGRTAPNNNERQHYSDASVGVIPFRIEGGVLVITAAPSADPAKTGGLPYTSGVITTHGSFAQRYGYFEIRAQFQPGQGLWPAFWLLNEDQSYPPEIDVIEVVNNDPVAHHNLHSVAGGRYRSFHRAVPIRHLFDGYHTFGVSWRPDVVEYYVNGRKTHTVATPADLHRPMYMIANLAVGGNWPGMPDRTTRFPAEMRIDYIRAWQYDDLM